MGDTEQTIVINDLLSFISCKIKQFSKEKIEKILTKFYPVAAVTEAEKTLIASLSDGDTLKYLKKKKDKDPFKTVFSIFEKVPEAELPIFVCKNLNNVPKLDNDEDLEDSNDEDVDELVTEQKFIKNQIAEISSVVYQLKDQIQLLAKHRKKNKNTGSQNGTAYPTSHNNETLLESQKLALKNSLKGSKSNGMAYLQILVDEEEMEKKVKLDINESSSRRSYEDMDDSMEEEAENLIQLIANRQQRASVKNVEAQVLNGGRKKVIKRSRQPAVKRKTEPSMEASSKLVVNEHEMFSDPEEEEIELQLDNDDFDPMEEEEEDDEGTTIIKKRKIRNHIVTEEVNDENIGKLVVHKCTLCNFSTNDESAINRHECPQMHGDASSHSEEVRTFKYFCLECKFRSNNRNLHLRHLEKHPQYFPCPFCEEKYEDPEDWIDHALQCVRDGDHKQEDHICPVCNVIYATSSAIRVHRGNHDLSRQFECHVCQFRFRDEHKLQAHMKSHSARGFKCPFCTYVHKNKFTFLTHIRTHTGETPYSCDLCDYRCSSSSAITAHMLCHSNVRDKKCDQCPAMFKSVQKLKAHKKIHLRGLEFRCPVCQESFNTAWLMTVHHSGFHGDPQQKSWVCLLCDFSSDIKEEFRAHVDLHEKSNIFTCSLCKYTAYEKGMLDAHMKQDHLLMEV